MPKETQAAIIERDGTFWRLTMWFKTEQDAQAAMNTVVAGAKPPVQP